MPESVADAGRYLRKSLGPKSRVLLVNPPVQERRYHWLRWNQPMELLRLSTWLKHAHPGIEVKLLDFMLPDANGTVPKHKVKETWTGSAADDQLWHFGQRFEAIEPYLAVSQPWCPTLVIVSSLTSYWHVSIEKLLIRMCALLGAKRRRAVKLALYGAYPRFEPEHAGTQHDADLVFTDAVRTRGHCPDFSLYLDSHERPPSFYAFDIEDDKIEEHLAQAIEIETAHTRRRGSVRPATVTTAFFNEDVCARDSKLEHVIRFVERNPKRLMIEGICGVEPRSLTSGRLNQLQAAGFRTLFVEHARLPGGGLDVPAYEPLLEWLTENERSRRTTQLQSDGGFDRSSVTGFVSMGLPDDNLDELVRATLKVNSFFQSVILKPFGYSPTADPAPAAERRRRWRAPYASAAQWFPYVDRGSRLTRSDYDNLLRWQNLLNKRVKGTTFDFLGGSAVPALVRETLVAESWKRHRVQ